MMNRAGLLVANSALGGQQSMGMATLKEITLRLKSTKNTQKITQSMKMVSAAKYAKAERDLKPVRPYGSGAAEFYEKVEAAPVAAQPKKLFIAISSDRGLCGGTHTTVCKAIKAEMLAAENPQDIAIVCVGDKARAQLSKLFSANMLLCCNEVGRTAPTYQDAAAVASAIINSGYEFGSGKVFYNRFKSVVAYETTSLPVFTPESVAEANKFSLYDSLDADVMKSYMEYSLTALIYYGMKEGACSEQSSRMTAMDAASKNAGEMIDKLTLTFNRTRQAVITGELAEIVSGAAAL